jgi:WD40 repeat protein
MEKRESLSVWRVATALMIGFLLVASAASGALGQAVETRIGIGEIGDLDWNHDGSRYAVAHDNVVEVFDAVTREVVLRLPAHPEVVRSVDFSPDGNRIATASEGSARVFDATTGALLLIVPGWDYLLNGQFGGKGETLLLSGLRERAELHDSRTGRRLVTFPDCFGFDNTAEISPDETRVLHSSRSGVLLLSDATTGARIRSIAGSDWSGDVCAISPDGSKAVVGVGAGEARIYDLTTGAVLLTLTGYTGASVSWSANGERILTTSDNMTARLLNASTGTEVLQLTGFAGEVRQAAISPDGTRALTSSDEATSLRLWDLTTGQQIDSRTGQRSASIVIWSPDETQVLSCGNRHDDAHLWDASTGLEISGVKLDRSYRWSRDRVTFLPDGPRLLSYRSDGIGLWDVATGSRIGAFDLAQAPFGVTVFSADGAKMVTTYMHGPVVLWDIATEMPDRVFDGHTDTVESLALSPDGTLLATGSHDATIRIWDISSGTTIHVFETDWPMGNVAFSTDGETVQARVSKGSGMLLAWDLATGSLIRVFATSDESVRPLAFSPDVGRVLTSGHDWKLRIWDSATGKVTRVFDHGDPIRTYCFSADGSLLATGGLDLNTVSPFQSAYAKVWDTRTGKRLATLHGHLQSVHSLSFSADGERLLAAGGVGSPLIWDWRNGAPKFTKGPKPKTDDISIGKAIPLTVRVSDDEGDPIDVIWSFGDGSTATGLDVTHTWTERGVFLVSVTANDGATSVVRTRKVTVGNPKRMRPRAKLRFDFEHESSDRLDLRLKAPLDLPADWRPDGSVLEVVFVSSTMYGDELVVGTTVTLDAVGRAETADEAARLMRISGSDLWRLDLALRRQDFETGGVPVEDGEWNQDAKNETVPVTIRVRLDGEVVWLTSTDLRYSATLDRRGKLRR